MRQAFNLYSADPAGKLTAERSVNGKKEKYLVAALKFIERGQLDKALAEFAKVIGEDPTDTRTLLKMGPSTARPGWCR